jgi:hypothetical protein
MNSAIVIPRHSETLISDPQGVSDPPEKILEKRLSLLAKVVSNQWSSRKFDPFLDKFFAVLSVIYFIGGAGLAGILILKAFSP